MPHFPARLRLLVACLAAWGARMAVAAAGWFYWDDLTLQAQAPSVSPFSLHDGHLMPAAWLVEKAMASYARLDWAAALIVLGVLQILAVTCVAWAAAGLSKRPALPVVVYGLFPLALPTAWLAVGINSLPVHAGLALAIGLVARRRLWPIPPVILLACLFSERALVIGPVLLLVAACLPGARITRRLLGVALVPTAVWGALYFLLADGASAAHRNFLWEVLWTGYAKAVAPTFAGGPWAFDRWHPGPPFAHVSWWQPVLGLAAAALVVWWSPVRKAWWPVLVYPAAPLVAIYLARESADTPLTLVLTLRHLSELAVLIAVVLAVQLDRKPAPLLPAAALVASCAVTATSFAISWHDQPARAYFAHLRAFDGKVLDQEASWDVLSPLVFPYNRLGALLPEKVSPAIDAPRIVGPDGTVIDADFFPARSTGEGPEEGCGWRAEGVEKLALDGPLLDREWVVQLNYFAPEAATATLALDGEAARFGLEPGLHQVYVQVTGGGSALTIDAPGACVGNSHVGTLIAR